jgi:hypothetical protein
MSAWTRDRSYSEASTVATGPTQSLVQGGKVAGAEGKNKSSYTTTLSRALMVCTASNVTLPLTSCASVFSHSGEPSKAGLVT